MRFFHSVQETRLFPAARDREMVRVHFLGDELRLAFHVGVGAREVRDFVDDVFAWLDRLNKGVLEPYQTRLKGVVLEGVVTWRSWHNCDYLNGVLPFKAQTWMERLAPNEVAIDQPFRHSLQVNGVPTSSFPSREFSGEIGYLLRG